MRRLLIILILLLAFVIGGCRRSEMLSDPIQTDVTEATAQTDMFTVLPDVIPEIQGSEDFFAAGASYDRGITTSYYHISEPAHLRDGDGLFLVCADEVEMNRGNHYDARFIGPNGVENLPRSYFLKEYTIRGENFTVAFEYTKFQNQYVITYVSDDVEQYRIYTDSGFGDYLIILFEFSQNGKYISYPALLNPISGELIDFLKNIPTDALPDGSMNAFSFMKDQRLLVKMNDGSFYFFDTPNGCIYSVVEWFGFAPERCAAIDDGIIFVDQNNKFRLLNTDDFTVSDLTVDAFKIVFFYGLNTTGNQTYVLYRDDQDKLYYYDFLSMQGGSLSEPDGWHFEDDYLYPSYDGRKVFQFRHNEEGMIDVLLFDCDRHQMILLERINENPVQERMIGWNRDGSLVIGSQSLQDFYVYQWKERETEMIQTDFASTFQPQDQDFVRVKDYIPDLLVEMKYAYPDNFTGHAIYEFEEAWLRYGTVKKLMTVQDALRPMGLGLKLWDGFRPVAAQFKLWDILPDDTYVANPNRGFSSHSRGNTVDITLVDSTGAEIPMPTGFDDFSTLADRDYSDCPANLAANAVLLENMMQENGFVGYFGEWWHFADSVKYDVETCFDPGIISTWYADCNEFISLRSAPSTDAPVLDRIPVREVCTLLGYHEEFAYVDFRGQRGYVLSSYLKKK